MYETRKKVHNLNKRYKNRIIGSKLEYKLRNSNKRFKFEEKVKNLNKNVRNYEMKRFFPFREITRNTFIVFFQFRETIETRRTSVLCGTVLYFVKKTKLSTLVAALTTVEYTCPSYFCVGFNIIQRSLNSDHPVAAD